MPDGSKSLAAAGLPACDGLTSQAIRSGCAVAKVNAAIEARVSVGGVSRGKSKVAAPGPFNEGNEFVVAETLDMPI